ncbi:MAG: aldo/keto reductase [Steroidobacteraceae bacterium]
MRDPVWTRRELLSAGGGCLAGTLLGQGLPGLAQAATAAPAVAAPGASAAGTLTIGGDMPVNRLGFGAMRITGDQIWGAPKDPAEAQRVLRRAVELGVNFIDTADAYGPNVSEELIAQALAPYPSGLVIATKGGFTRPNAGSWTPDGSPAHLTAACDASLKRLRLERIDLYQLHTVDRQVPLEDSVGALQKLQQAGKIRHIGLSNVSAAQLAKARSIVRVVSVQNRYNLDDRGSDEVLTICQRDGLAFIPWAPLGQSTRSDSGRSNADSALAQLATRRGISPAQAALAWLLARSPAMLPIPGTSSVAHLEQNVAAAGVKLSAQELASVAA